MKKKGVTLVELIAVMSIMTVILVAIFGIYLTGIKRAESTKTNADIEKEYRNFYQIMKESIKENRSDIKLFYNNGTLQWWNFYDVGNKNNKFINECKSNGYDVQKAYLAMKDKDGVSDNILISFGNGKIRTFYMIKVKKGDIEYKAASSDDSKGAVNINGNILAYRKICDDVTKFKVNENNSVYYFYLQYTKNGISRDYDFSVNKTDERVVSIGNGEEQEDNNSEGDNSDENLENFYNEIGSLTLLNGNGNIMLHSSTLEFYYNSSYYFNGVLSGEEYKFPSKFIGYNNVFGQYNLENLNENNSVKPIKLGFANGSYTNNNKTVASIIQEMKSKNIDTVLIKKNDSKYIYYDYRYCNEPISNFIGAIMKDNNGYIVLINGDVYLQGNVANDLLVYSTGNIIINNYNQYYKDVTLKRCSLVSCKNIQLLMCYVTMKGQYKVTDNTKNLIEQFLKK